MRRRARSQGLLAALAATLAGCLEVPELPSASLVDRPRVLAIVADPPEVNPGEEATLTVLLGGFDAPPTLRFRVCSAFASTERNRQYEEMTFAQGCSGTLNLDLGEGPSAVLPAAASQALFDNLELAAEVLGVELPEAAVRALREQVGLPLLVEVNAEYEGRTLRAMKRILVSERAEPHQNPPPPSFSLGTIPITAMSHAPFECTTDSGEVPRVEPGSRVELTPLVDGDSEPWVERYHVLDVYGELQVRDEVPTYAWFTSAGSLAEEITRAPLRNQLWRAPVLPQCARLWLVVRDGHGGTSGCGLDVAVGDPRACEP